VIDPRKPNFASTPIAPDRPGFGYSPLRSRVAGARPVPPAVSVVTPFFNTGGVFHETAACLLGRAAENSVSNCPGQSLQNFEWIIVNDGSADGAALEMLDGYRSLSQRDERIRVIDHRVNHGLPAARNTGWRAARAPLVFFLDSDDLIEPTTLEKCALHLACNPEFGFVKGFSVGFGAQEYLWTRGFHERDAMLRTNTVTATAMVRASVLREVGGFDESVRAGMEDWDFWIRCSAEGHWGDSIPEFLDWYRRRENQHGSWLNLSRDDAEGRFVRRVRATLGPVERAFPTPERRYHMPFADLPEACGRDALPANPLDKRTGRLLMIVPWLRMGGADRFNLDLIRYLTRSAGWEVTVATTLTGHAWLSEFGAVTPDVFCLDHIAQMPHFPRLIDHLIGSRRPDVVMVSNSQLGYLLLPYLRSRHPDVTFVDLNHMEEPHWENGGHARTGAGFQEQLDLSIVVSEHLKRWMCDEPRRAEAERVEVCRIHVDAGQFRPDVEARERWREKLGIAEGASVILYAARLCAQKQPLVFGRAMELLRDNTQHAARGEQHTTHSTQHTVQTQDWVALVAGEGELGDELAEFVRERGLEGRVRMLGAVPAADMRGVMSAADIFFLPSKWEGSALTVYEAMSAGLAVVGADVGGQRELVTPETGILLRFGEREPEREAAEYAAVLGRLLGDPRRVRALGAAARERIVREFGFEAMGARMLELFGRAERFKREYPRQVVSAGLARELALQGVEMLRIQELAEQLWVDRERGAADERARVALEARREVEALAELGRLEATPAWRFVQAVKRSGAYGVLARARFGAGWERVDPKEPAHLRLERVRASRAGRLVEAVQRLRR